MSFENERFLSPEPEVVLEKAFENPFATILTSARTCYSARGIVREEDLKPGQERLARDIYQAGHHTTLQHAHFQFSLANVSRQFLWSFLHAHPFYNSEQVSQRYVAVREGHYAIPPLNGEALEVYRKTAHRMQEAYAALTEALIPAVTAAYYGIFPGRRWHRGKYDREVRRKAQEVGRYVLPVATFAYLYHTVSGLTLLRYHRLCDAWDAPLEQRVVVGKMVRVLLDHDPRFGTILQDPLPLEETPEYRFFSEHRGAGETPARASFREEFDRSLEGRVSRLVDWKARAEQTLASSVREVLGLPASALSDDEAIRWVLDPSRNRLLGESLVLTTHSKLSRALVHPSWTFRRKLSHTADSQDQRHRMTPASRPILHAHRSDQPDVIVPPLVNTDPGTRRLFDSAVTDAWDGMQRLRTLGVREEFVQYLLPNAASIRFTESADLLNLHHKHAMRLCYNAQEEIWRASLDEAAQIREVHPRIGRYLLPPCGIRNIAGARPVCPEGARYCGVTVWKLEPEDYRRAL